MPCRDYESDTFDYAEDRNRLKEQADRLARIACKAMTALEEMGKEDFLLLKDNEVREWWEAHKEADRRERARVAEQQRREAVKQEALNKLSDEEKELLGLKKPVSKKKITKAVAIPTTYDKWDEQEEVQQLVEAFKKIYPKGLDTGSK